MLSLITSDVQVPKVSPCGRTIPARCEHGRATRSDVYRIFVAPVLLGGKSLFGDIQDEVKLELVNTKVFGAGHVMRDYQPGAEQP